MNQPEANKLAPVTIVAFVGLAVAFWLTVTLGHSLFNPVRDFVGVSLDPKYATQYAVWLGFVGAFTFIVRKTRLELLPPAVTRHWKQIAIGCSVVATCIAGFWAVVVMEQSWMADDTHSYLVQAEGILRGTVTVPAPPAWKFLTNNLTFPVGERGGVLHWSGPYMPGQPLLLALSIVLGWVFLTQLLLTGLIVFHTAALTRELADERAATLAAFLIAFSPMVTGIGGTLHTAVPTTAFALFAARSLLRWTRTRSVPAGFATGFFAAFAVCCRPIEGAAIVFACCAVFAYVSYRDKTLVRSTLLLASGAALPTLFLAATNYMITGSPFEIPYSVLSKWVGEFYGPFSDGLAGEEANPLTNAIASVVVTTIHLSVWMLGAPTAIVAAYRRGFPPGLKLPVKVSLGAIAFVVGAYTLAPFVSLANFGSYYHLAIVPVVVALVAISATMERASGESEGFNWPTILLLALAFTWSTFVPFQMQQVSSKATAIQAPIRAAAEQANPPAIIFYKEPLLTEPYATGVLFGPLPVHEDQPYFWARRSTDDVVAKVAEAHSDRVPYEIEWDGQAWVVRPLRLSATAQP